jgi:hypothetical protein
MSVNKYLPHIYVLPEDDANRQLANGFYLDERLWQRQFYILEEAGGWNEVIERFCSIYSAEMDRIPERFMVLLIDLDNRLDRLEWARKHIPGHLRDRVFILGVLTEPEDLKHDLGSLETIGLALAKDCREDTTATWGHGLLQHNAEEIGRLRVQLRPILFPNR